MTSIPPQNPPRPGKPRGLIRATPTPKQLDEYRRELRRRANDGDTLALGLVVLCESIRQRGTGQ